MRSNHISSKKGQLNKKKRLIGFLLILLWIVCFINRKPDDIFYILTSYFLPALTYETEFGSADKDYLASYEVPDWFYEDESSSAAGADMAVMDNNGVESGNEQSKNGVEDTLGNISGNDADKLDGDGQVNNKALIKNESKGTTFTRKQLSKPDFLTSKIFVVDSNTSMSAAELDISNLLDADMSLHDLPDKPKTDRKVSESETIQTDKTIQADNIMTESKAPYKVLIYHTHSSESFADSRAGVKEDTVVGVGAYLAKLLNEEYAIPTYHDETTYDVIDGVLDRSKAYENSFSGISKILAENPTIEVVIDLHRDGVDEETHLVTEVNGKPTAKIMFLNGVSRSNLNGEIDYLENPNKLSNLAFSFQLYLAGKEAYGDFVRKIYVRSLRYNLHVMPRATLIEAGAQNNTLEEEKNAMEPLAAMLDKVLRNSH